MSNTKRILTYLLIITIIITAFRVSLFSLKFILASEFPIVVVKGYSMEITFYDGDLLVVKGVADKHDVNLMDIIVFRDPFNRNILIVHRVVKIISDSSLEFVTQGDNNKTNTQPDPWRVQEADIIGVVIARIHSVGPIFLAIESPVITIFLIGLLVIEYVGYSRNNYEKEDIKKTTIKENIHLN